MSLLMGGVVVAVLGLISLIFWWADFMSIIRGAFPISLLLGGALAVYVGMPLSGLILAISSASCTLPTASKPPCMPFARDCLP